MYETKYRYMTDHDKIALQTHEHETPCIFRCTDELFYCCLILSFADIKHILTV